jgi:hypothetical protein
MTGDGERTVPGEAGKGTGGDVAAELAEVRAERDALAAKLDRRERRQAEGGRFRKVFVGLLVGLSIVLIPVTTTITWAHQTVLNTGRWVSTVGPIAQDPRVIAAVSAKVTDEIYAAVDPQRQIGNALTQLQQQVPKVPAAITALAGPIANGMKGVLSTGVNKVLSSQEFRVIWTTANRVAHAQLVAVLHGQRRSLQTVNGQVVLNLVPLLNDAIGQVQGTLGALLGRNITLPTLSGNELPSVACQKISSALGRPLPQTCGQIPLFPADKLGTVQQLVTKFDRWTTGLLILTPLLIIAAIWLSKRRRRTALQIAIGGVLGLVVIRRLTMYLEGRIEGLAKPENKAAADAIVNQVLHRFYDVTLILGVVALAVALVLLVTGPYRWAQATRVYIRRGAVAVGATTASVSRALVGRAGDDATQTWIRHHRGVLQIYGVAVAVILLLAISLSPLSLLIIAVLLAAYLAGLARIAPNEESPDDQSGREDKVPLPPPTPRTG